MPRPSSPAEESVGIMTFFLVAFDGDGLTLTCKGCGEQLHYGPAYHISALRAEAALHLFRCSWFDATHP